MVLRHINSGESRDREAGEFVESVAQPDPRTIIFGMTKGIMCYDGASHGAIGESDAEDVKYSPERMKVPEWKDKAVAPDHVEATGIIHPDQPFAPVWLTWLREGTGAILSKKAAASTTACSTSTAVAGPTTWR